MIALEDPVNNEKLQNSVIDSFLALGQECFKWAHRNRDSCRKLTVAITVPRRTMAAVLITAGWSAAQLPPSSLPLRATSPKSIPIDNPVRLATNSEIIQGKFQRWLEKGEKSEISISGRRWLVDEPCVIWQLNSEIAESNICLPDGEPFRSGRVPLGPMTTWEDIPRSELLWAAFPGENRLLVGTKTRIEPELGMSLVETSTDSRILLGNLLQTDSSDQFSWGTRLIGVTSAHETLAEFNCTSASLVVLDGAGAAEYMNTSNASVTVAIFDRCREDFTPINSYSDYRANMAEPVDLKDELNWHPHSALEVDLSVRRTN